MMINKQTQYTWLLIISILLSLLAAQLLADKRLGLNFIVFEVICIIAMLSLRKLLLHNDYAQIITKKEIFYIAAGAVFSLCLIVRMSPVLYGLNILALAIIMLLAFRQKMSGSIANIAIISWLKTPFALLRLSVQSMYKLVSLGVKPSALISQEKNALGSIFFGILWALPVLFLLGSLLVSADSRFEEFTLGLFALDISSILNTMLYFPMVCAFFYITIMTFELPLEEKKESLFQMDSVQLITILSLVNLLFLSYIMIQFSYFFGGDKIVMHSAELSYSSYARRGFWELIFLSMLVIPLLLIAHWSQHRASNKFQQWFKTLALIMLISLLIIELSALHRMFLYVKIYGLTELRFYSSVFMFFMMTGLISFYFTVLNNKRGLFVAVMSVQAVLVILLLNLVNPDAQIAYYNMSHDHERPVDTYYLKSLSSDAYPSIYNMRQVFSYKKSCLLQQQLRYDFQDMAITWQQWNGSIYAAQKLIDEWYKECNK